MNIKILLVLYILFLVYPTSAVEMESPRFRIESGKIDLTEPEKKLLIKPVDKNPEAEEFESTGIIIKTDNQSTKSTPFRFLIEKSLLSMGNVKPNNPALVSSTVSISGGRTVYQILVSESDFLRKLSGETIPDTTCNSQKKCVSGVASVWDSLATYGFGYTVEGHDISDDFINKNYYRPFPNSKKNAKPIILMKGFDKTEERHTIITLKTIVSPIQADGTYENTLNFIATPGY